MRRLLLVVLAALVAAVWVLPAGATVAADAATSVASSGTLVLAAEGGDGEAPAGPEPNLKSSNAPDEYEPPFLINAAVGLVALLLAGIAILAGLYYLLVKRPAMSAQGTSDQH